MNPNPFEWRGPEFLVFYLALIGVMVGVIWWWRRRAEGGITGEELALARDISPDPYALAFLRGGRYEAVHVAVVALLEQGLLEAEGDRLRAAPEAVEKARHPLEKAILSRFVSPLKTMGTKAGVIYTDTTIMAEADAIGETLEARQLLPDDEVRGKRKGRLIVAVGLLWAVAAVKILVAVTHGHTNIGFLVILAVLAAVVLLVASRRFRTSLGDKTQQWTQELFSHLRNRRDSLALNTTGSELTFLAAVYGLALLPDTMSELLNPLALRPPREQLTTWGSGGCGSSCASFSSCGSSSCSSGSSCGGGGCGGGGGGCGGCGGG